jgi:hypothetical protein
MYIYDYTNMSAKKGFSQVNHLCAKRRNDVFYTPPELAKDTISLVPLVPGDVVLDPFFGKGVFYDHYPDFVQKEWCEIELGRDFFDFEGEVDWVISNPPFSLMTAIIEKMIKICRKGFAIISQFSSISKKREKILVEAGFVLIRLEPFFVGKGWPSWIHVIQIWAKRDAGFGGDIRKLPKYLYPFELYHKEEELGATQTGEEEEGVDETERGGTSADGR